LAEGLKPVEIHRRMLAQYGQSTMSQRKVYEWVERFKLGRTHVTDEGRSVRPSRHTSSQEQPKRFFSSEIQELAERYKKFIVLQ